MCQSRYLHWGAVFLLLAGCGEEAEVSPRALLEAEEAGPAECSGAGGVVILTGLDSSGDGLLQESEVTAREVVCNGVSGEPGRPGGGGDRPIFARAVEPAGDNCPNGGERVEIGLDADGDGELDASEVQQTRYVCRGEDGESAMPLLTRVGAPEAGACGPAGGTRFEAGLDADGDGTLDLDEVTEDRTLCNGEVGRRTLIQVEPEPPGANCSPGGRRITTGIDEDGDGMLSAAEVLDEDFLCDLAVPLAVVTDLPSGDADCAFGGQRIDSGLDLNGDGALEASEVVETAFACGGPDAPDVRTRRTSLAPGAECPAGGTRVEVGVDGDRDGALTPGEVTSVAVVCSGEAGLDGTRGSAVRLAEEPPGSSCSVGGTRIETGIDANANGVLDDAEVASTRFVCSVDVAQALVDLVPELPGTTCPSGGQRIRSGRDLDGDGRLQTAEVTATVVVCSVLAQVPIRVEPAALVDGLLSNPYSAQITAVGGAGGSYAWSIAAGALPPGVTLDAAGTPTTNLSGTPTQAGTFTFTVRVEDFFGNADTEAFTLTIAPPFDITSFRLPRLAAGTPYSARLTVAGGVAPFTWTVLEGGLPAGLTLASDGTLSGTPATRFGGYVIFQVADSTGATRRVGIDLKGEQRFLAYCGDVNTDGTNELVVGRLGAGGALTATVSVNFSGATADCADQIEFAPGRDAIAFTGEVTSGIEELFVADLSGFPTVSTYRVNAPYTSSDQDVLEFAWSSTGDFIGFRADEDVNSREELYVADVRSLPAITRGRANGPISGTSSALEVESFQWVPLSNKLIYASDELVSGERNLYFYDAASGGARVQVNGALPTSADVNLNYELSPNGRFLAYTSDERVNDDTELFLVDVSGAAPTAPTVVSGVFATGGDVSSGTGDIGFSPNGDLLFFVGDADNLGQEVYVRDVRNLAQDRVRVSPELTSTLFSTDDVRWSPDSRRLAVRGDWLTSAVTELYFIDAAVPGTALRASGAQVSSADVNLLGDTFAWSPNGDYAVFSYDGVTSGDDEPYLAFVDGTSPTRMFASGIEDDLARTKISEDGRFVFTAVDFAGISTLELFVTEVTGSMVSAPVAVNASPLGSTQSLREEFVLVEGGRLVVYISDEVTVDRDEGRIRSVSSGPTVGSASLVHSPLPTGGAVAAVLVQEE